jgi:acyl-CoA thioester hydrolase
MKKVVVEYRVPYADTDMMGIVYYANYLALFERGRNELMRECGYTYKQCEEEGFGLPVIHAEVDYRGSAKYDDLLEITAFVSAVKGVRVEISCEIRRKGEENILVRGFTRHAFVDLKTFRPCALTEKFKKALSEGIE